MTTEALVDYIKNQISKNISRNLIISRLLGVGWKMEDIEEAMDVVVSLQEEVIKTEEKETPEKIIKNKEVENSYKVDPYHESIEDDETNKDGNLIEPSINKIEEPIVGIIKEKPIKIWTPSVIKPVQNEIDQKKEEEIKIEENQVVIKPVNTKTIEVFQEELSAPNIQKEKILSRPIVSDMKAKKEETEINPILIPKPIIEKEIEVPPRVEIIIPSSPEKEKVQIDSLSKIPMISSYSNDLETANNTKKEIVKKKNNYFLRQLIIVLIICLIAATIFYIMGIYKV